MKKLYTIIIMLFVITLHGQNKLLSSIEENYNGSIWENFSGYNYEYDSNNNLITETYLEWNNGAWKINEKVTYTYNGSNKVVGELGQVWNETTNALENSYRDTYTYTNGYFTGQVAEIWMNSSWTNEWKNDIVLNINNLPINVVSYNWDGANWEEDSRSEITYNSNNKVIQELSGKVENSIWVNEFRGLYTYDANSKMTSSKYEELDGSSWVENEREEYALDATGNRISNINFFNSNSSKTEYAYNELSLMSDFAHPFKDKNGFDYLTEDFPYVNKVLTSNRYYYDDLTSSYVLSGRTTYNYDSAITLSTKKPEIVNTSITVSPNPVSAVLNVNATNITIDKIVVFDVTGRTVLQQEANATQVNVEKLPAGLYILEAYSGNEKFTSKFVKK